MSTDASTPTRNIAIAGTLVGLVVLCLALGLGLILGCLIATRDPVVTIRTVVVAADLVAIAAVLLKMAKIGRALYRRRGRV